MPLASGWSGNPYHPPDGSSKYTITEIQTSTEIATGSLDDGFVGSRDICLQAGCYVITVDGYDPSEFYAGGGLYDNGYAPHAQPPTYNSPPLPLHLSLLSLTS